MPVITQFMECPVSQLALESLQLTAAKGWHTEIRAEEHPSAPELLSPLTCRCIRKISSDWLIRRRKKTKEA